MQNNNIEFYGKFCIETSPIPNTIIIFGASGDLAHRKLIPAMFSLYRRQLFHEKSMIIGCARSKLDDDSFRDKVACELKKRFNLAENDKKMSSFLKKISYLSGDYNDPSTYKSLYKILENSEKSSCCSAGRIYYLSTPATLYTPIIKLLGEYQLVQENYQGIPWRNVVIEKPFGHDLESARKLDREIHSVLKERQIYRIDHYLGKETVQNILMLRFANIIFEPVWNNRYIDNIQITVAESLGVEHRAGYYEQSGLLRDMFQNHMLEMLSLVAMEPPPSFAANRVRDEKVKLLRSIQPFNRDNLDQFIVRAQYGSGTINGKQVPAYRSEQGTNAESTTETYVAAKMFIDNWRWRGVPFYLRSGKRLNRRVSEIAITFKQVPHSIFHPIKAEDLSPNVLVLNVQPEEGVALTIQAKQPGPKLCMGSLSLDFKYRDLFNGELPEAYERLILDSMLGDQTLFIRSDTIELAWELLTPVLDEWAERGNDSLFSYTAGTWGPVEAVKLLRANGHYWKTPDSDILTRDIEATHKLNFI